MNSDYSLLWWKWCLLIVRLISFLLLSLSLHYLFIYMMLWCFLSFFNFLSFELENVQTDSTQEAQTVRTSYSTGDTALRGSNFGS